MNPIPHISTYPNQQQIKIFTWFKNNSLNQLFIPYIKFRAILGNWLAVDNNVADACCSICA